MLDGGIVGAADGSTAGAMLDGGIVGATDDGGATTAGRGGGDAGVSATAHTLPMIDMKQQPTTSSAHPIDVAATMLNPRF
jgi:hypothetical protein